MSSDVAEITLTKHGNVAVISINRPSRRNALGIEQIWAIEEYLISAATDDSCTATLITSSGNYFSAGGDYQDPAAADAYGCVTEPGQLDVQARRRLAGPFFGRNSMLTSTFWNHPKLLAVALNGPAIGISAALVVLADLIIADGRSEIKPWIKFPFAQLALVSECAAASVLPLKIGYSLASQALLTGEAVSYNDLKTAHFFTAILDSNDFAKAAIEYIQTVVSKVSAESLYALKAELHQPYNTMINAAVHAEAATGIERFARGYPQQRLLELAFRHQAKL